MKKAKVKKSKPFVVLGQHASGPDFDYKRVYYSDGSMVETKTGNVPENFRRMLDTGEQGESDSATGASQDDYAKALEKITKRSKT